MDWGGIEFPTPCFPKTFQTFKKTNEISICIFGLDETNNIVPLYVSETPHPKTVRLFYQKGKEGGGHYSLISNMSRLVGSQISKHKEKNLFATVVLMPLVRSIMWSILFFRTLVLTTF